MERVQKSPDIAETHEGEENIFHFLAFLNDLVRLSKKFEIPFPYGEYRATADFPRVEIEFFHLQGMGSQKHGKFMMLDTPGFNEAGQVDDLFAVMCQQMQNATAVLAILDYTQLGSEAEAKLRNQLDKSAEFSKGRLFALVNRIDQKNARAMNAEETREFVSRNLLHASGISMDRIFPVSAYLAYLAKWTECTLAEKGSITVEIDGDHDVIHDFAEKNYEIGRASCRERV